MSKDKYNENCVWMDLAEFTDKDLENELSRRKLERERNQFWFSKEEKILYVERNDKQVLLNGNFEIARSKDKLTCSAVDINGEESIYVITAKDWKLVSYNWLADHEKDYLQYLPTDQAHNSQNGN